MENKDKDTVDKFFNRYFNMGAVCIGLGIFIMVCFFDGFRKALIAQQNDSDLEMILVGIIYAFCVFLLVIGIKLLSFVLTVELTSELKDIEK